MYTEAATVRLVLKSTGQDQARTAADLDDDQIEYEIKAAGSLIDANLRFVYPVPFDPVPDLITSICTDIAAFRSDLNYRESREYDSQNMPIILRYNSAKETLMQLRMGSLTLNYERTDISDHGAVVIHQYPGPLFDWDSVFGHRAEW